MIKSLKLCIAFLFAAALPVQADVIVGKIVAIADGDTITVLTDQKESVRIRLAGIDAPEKGQAFGQASKEHLSRLAFEKFVEIHYQTQDRYGRIVGKVLLDGIDICLMQIRNGFAWHYKKYEMEQEPADRTLYVEAEEQARADQLGLWSEANPIAPWDHRRSKLKPH